MDKNDIKFKPKIGIVIPCYNEEQVLFETNSQLVNTLSDLINEGIIDSGSKLIYVDDGSKDKTWDTIAQLHINSMHVEGIKLAKNVGHQKALLAGLMTSKDKYSALISIDADLQDDINVIREFVLKFIEGFEIVYGVRKERAQDTFFKRNTALLFYKLMNLLGVSLISNHADFRLMGKKALDALEKYNEVNLFLRGIIPTIGYPTTAVYYDRKKRFAGHSKYPLKKMLELSFDGITSFSIKPLRAISTLGGLILLSDSLYLIYSIIQNLLGNTITGWTSVIISIWLIGGFQILAIGVIGEYIGKIYQETKNRPKYFIEKLL